MTKTLKLIPRHQLDAMAWDACIAASPQRILYGYSWYLDAVLPAPDWKWVGLILPDESGTYLAVMPVPLRRKAIAGITYEWVVHQPFFCQFLDVFSPDESVDSGPFLAFMVDQFRYGSIYSTHQQPDHKFTFKSLTTHILDLSTGYETIFKNYAHDRKANLRRARREFSNAAWTIVESTDTEPLLTLFRANHADTIEGGVANWAYAMFRKLASELSKRTLIILRYALHEGSIEAGALFVREGNRIIYLFNASSELGRKANARTLLIDQLIQEYAGKPVLFDFESPAKSSIRRFYQSFGAVEQPFWTMRWSRLTILERALLTLKRRF